MKKLEKEIETMGIEELAILLHKIPQTIRKDLGRRPESLPPRLIIPGSRRLVWLKQDVRTWLESCRA